MFSAIRRRLHLSPATVIAGLALVFAMTGGAYAAKKYLITSTKQISPSVLKQLQGKAGAAGAPGAAGAQGAQGPAGPVGAAGAGGAKGETGPAGAKGATGATGAKGATGATGATGETGFTEKLPKGKTETGTWSSTAGSFGKGGMAEEEELAVAISFPIPLASSGKAFHLTLKETEQSATNIHGCTGTIEIPTAPAGTLCVYTSEEARPAGENRGHLLGPEFRFNLTEEEYLPTGTVMRYYVTKEPAFISENGTWAVTAP